MTARILTQISVIKALTIQDFQSANATLSYGYAWAVVDVMLSISILLLLKLVIRGLSPPNMPPVMFLLLGALPWFTFAYTAQAMLRTLSLKKKYLVLPGITSIDILLSKAVSLFCTYGTLFVGSLTVACYFEGVGPPANIAGLALTYIAAWLLGIGIGMVLMPFVRYFPPGAKFLSPIWRIGLLSSAVYFSISVLPSSTWVYFSWNPMVHVSELMRVYWFSTYQSPVANPMFLALCVPIVLFFGLSVERYFRYRAPL